MVGDRQRPGDLSPHRIPLEGGQDAVQLSVPQGAAGSGRRHGTPPYLHRLRRLDGGGPLTALLLGSYTEPCRRRTHGQGKGTGIAIAVRRSGAPVRRGARGRILCGRPVDPYLPPTRRRSVAAHGRFRITDRPNEKWPRRFNRFKYGEPSAARAAARTFCAAFGMFSLDGNPRIVVVSSVSSGQNIAQHDTPASKLASALAG